MEDYKNEQWWIELQEAMKGFDENSMNKISDGKLKQINSQIIGGIVAGNKNARNGHCKKIASLGGKAHVESGHLNNIRAKAHQRAKELFSKPIQAFCKETGELKLNFTSAKDAARNGFDGKKVRECLKLKRKTHLGFIWKYKE